MLKILSYFVIICIILVSRGAVRVLTEELPVRTTENEVGSGQTDTQSVSGVDVEVSTDHPSDVHLQPQEPYPHMADDVDDGDDDTLIPPTPTDDLHAAGSKGSKVSPVDTENMGKKDSTSQDVDYTMDSSVTDKVTQIITQDDVSKVTDDKKVAPADTENNQQAEKGEAVTSTEAENVPKVFTQAKDDELILGVQVPPATQVFDEIPQTQIVDASRVSHQLPSSEGGPYTYDLPKATEALKSVNAGTWDGVSELPIGVGGMAVDPQIMQDAMIPTHFSLDDDDGKKKATEKEFPTFDKWSMQYLAEQEKQKIEKEQEQAASTSTLLVQKKLRQNFAASSCGAKVVASNAEAENINYLLNGNPDEYLLSPCKAKKWFVVELCEPLQIHKVEMGSLEMFASQPKSFRLSASQRFPTKDWMPLGKFDMSADRVIQSFSTQVNEEFVKFVRVEILEHHGDEHYCPITTFRVLGVDMASDDEDVNDNEVVESDDEKTIGDIEDDEVEESVNLFTSAKETVVKLVKKVLYKGDQEDDGKEGHTTPDNATAKVEEKKDYGSTCLEKSKDSLVTDTPTVIVPEPGSISPPTAVKEPEEIPIVTKLADTEQLPMVLVEMPVVIKLDQDADAGSVDRSKHDLSGQCSRSSWNTYVMMMAKARHQPSTCSARPRLTIKSQVESSFPSDKEIQGTVIATADMTGDKPGDFVKNEVHYEGVPTEGAVSSDSQAESDAYLEQKSISQTEQDKLSSASLERLQTENGGKVLSTEDYQQQQQQQAEERSSTSQILSFTSSDISSTKPETLEPSSLCNHAESEDVSESLQTPGLTIQQSQVVEQGTANLAETIFLKVSPSPTISSGDSVAGDEDTFHEGPTASEQQADQKVEDDMSRVTQEADHVPGPEGHFDGFSEQTKTQNIDRNVTGPATSKTAKPIDLVTVGVPSSSAKRDTSIMKLSNRIMALEQNVSMTKKYLEELSRAFKQQNEDMMKLLNKTEKKLNSFIIQSEEKDLRQQSMIDVLELKMSNLTQVVDTMQLQMNALGKELGDTKFLLAFFQAIMFLWLMITSYRGRGKSPLVYTDHQFLLDTMPTKPTIERTEGGGRQRRNSDGGIQSGTDPASAVLKRQISEANLAPAGGNKQQSTISSGSVFLQETVQVSKKRKKKKLKQPQLSVDSGSSLSAATKSGSFPAQSSSFSSCAGVLFGTDSSYHPKENFNIKGSVSEAAAKAKDGQIVRKDINVTFHQEGHVRATSPDVGPSSLAGDPKPGLLVMRDESCKDVMVFKMSGFRDKAPLPLSISQPYEDQVPTFHYNGHQSLISDMEFSKSRPSDRSVSLSSPEFKLPQYHKSRIRKLGESSASEHQGSAVYQGVRGEPVSTEEFKRRRSVGFINPKGGEEFFLAENYMSENRFKFPSSTVSDTTLESGISLGKSTDLFTFAAGFIENGIPVSEQRPQLSASSVKQFQAQKPPHHKSMSSLSSSSSSALRSSTSKSLPLTPSFIQFDHSAAHVSFSQDLHIPQSLSQLSSKSLPKTIHPVQRDAQSDHADHSPAQIPKPRPVIVPGRKSSLHSVDTTSKDIICSNVPAKGIGHYPSGESNHNKQLNEHQTHRRQGSSPVIHLRSRRSVDKESQQGSAEGLRQLGRSGLGNLQGTSKMRKSSSLSNFSKKSFGSKTSVHDGTAHLAPSKKGP